MINQSLMNSSHVRQSLASLAETVEKSGDPSGADRLRGLSEALEKKGPSTRAWASSDIYKVIDPDSIVERYRQRHAETAGCLVEILEMARNVLIFAPIVVTWYGISQAAEKYNELVSESLQSKTNQISQPFLYLWQQAFGGRLPGWLTLSSIAMIDVIILLSILLLTFFVHSLSNASRMREERKSQQFQAELVHVVARAALCIHNTQHPQLISPVDNLDKVAQRIEDMADQIVQSFDTLKNNLTARFTQIANDLSAQLQQGGQYLNQLGATASSLHTLSQEMRAAAQHLEDANRELTMSINALLGPAANLAQQQQYLLQAVNQSVTLLEDNTHALQANADVLKDIASQQGSWASDLADSLDTMNISTKKSEDMATKLGSFISQQNDFLLQIKDEREAQARLLENMTKVTVGMQDALDKVHAMARDVRQVAVDTNDTLRLYASLPRTLQTDMVDIVKRYTDAAQVIEKGGRDLSEAATSIFNASQYLQNVIAEQERVITELEKHLTTI